MNIAILDDNEIFASDLKERILRFDILEMYSPEVSVFTESISFFSAKQDFDIILIDYKLDNESGMDVARKIRKVNKVVHIIFITAYPEYVFDSFKVDAFRYLVKPVSDDELKEALDDYIRQDIRFKIVRIPEKGKNTFFKASNIIYLETDGRNTIIHMENDKYVSKKPIGEIEECIDSFGFCRISRFFVVNLDYVTQVVKNTVELSDGHVLSISRGRRENFNKHYIKYLQMKI